MPHFRTDSQVYVSSFHGLLNTVDRIQGSKAEIYQPNYCKYD